MKRVLNFIGSTILLGILVWILTLKLAIAPAQAIIHQLEEAPGQMVYQSRQTLNDQQGRSWRVIAFKRTFPDRADSIYLRIVGFPGTATIDHTQPLTLTNSMGKTLTAADVSQDMFADKGQSEPEAGQYDLQPILMQLEAAIPWRLRLPTLDQAEITLNVAPEGIEEWRSLMEQH